uniref:Nucleotide exchange factor SIL1 n=1 Tax=Oreochromis aureus TaxID=47969 RepID=A0A668SCU0_OREAU
MKLIPFHTGGVSFILAVLLVLHYCHIASILGHKSGGDLIVVENTEHEAVNGEQEEVAVDDVEDDEGDLDVVQPSEQWQTLKPGQAVPQGSHVRLNLQTGEREVRLGEEQLKYWTEEHREEEELRSSFNPDELKRAMKKIKEDWKLASKDTEQKDSVASKFRTMEELKKDMAQLDLLLETDVQIMKRLLEQFNSSNSTTEQRLSILTELEYLVHQVDNAQTLCSMGGLQFILEGLNSSDFRLQESSAFVLGSALASNPAVQVEAVENGALQTLLTTLATAQQLRVKKKVCEDDSPLNQEALKTTMTWKNENLHTQLKCVCVCVQVLFAVASLLRHFPYAQRHFLTHGGLQVLSELFRTDDSGVLRTRIVTMLYDMITEKELIFQGGLDPVLDASHDERRRQYSKVSLQEELLEKGWCTLVPQLLESSENDYREKALQALLAMAPVCLDQYRSDGSLQASLHSLKQEYQEMIQSEIILGEENSYFEEIVELIDALQVKMK